MENSPQSTSGDRKQVVSRVARILSAIASGAPHGVRLVHLAKTTGIARPTVHRLLNELKDVGYIEQLPDKRYTLGRNLSLLGMTAPAPIGNVVGLQSIAQKLSDTTGDTVYIALRTFNAAYYLARTEGAYPVRAQSVEIGELIPFTASYSGLVFLAQLPTTQQEQILAHVENTEPTFKWRDLSPEEYLSNIKQALNRFQTDGYIYGHDLVVSGVSGLAVPIPAKTGLPYMALSISGINARLAEDRKDRLLRELFRSASAIAEVAGDSPT